MSSLFEIPGPGQVWRRLAPGLRAGICRFRGSARGSPRRRPGARRGEISVRTGGIGGQTGGVAGRPWEAPGGPFFQNSGFFLRIRQVWRFPGGICRFPGFGGGSGVGGQKVGNFTFSGHFFAPRSTFWGSSLAIFWGEFGDFLEQFATLFFRKLNKFSMQLGTFFCVRCKLEHQTFYNFRKFFQISSIDANSIYGIYGAVLCQKVCSVELFWHIFSSILNFYFDVSAPAASFQLADR